MKENNILKQIILILVTLATLQAQNFSKQTLLGMWELSSVNLNATVAFGTYLGKERGEVLQLLFNPQGRVKVLSTDDVYNYAVQNGELVIYQTKVYRNNYKIKNKNRYDLFKIVQTFEGCQEVKVIKKKIPGYTSKYNLKMCKISNLPQPTYQENISKYRF